MKNQNTLLTNIILYNADKYTLPYKNAEMLLFVKCTILKKHDFRF